MDFVQILDPIPYQSKENFDYILAAEIAKGCVRIYH